MFSILILTKNEEANIGACLDSLSWCDDVVVLDSHSTDRTRDIATARGARVFERAFDDFGRSETMRWITSSSRTRGCFTWMRTRGSMRRCGENARR